MTRRIRITAGDVAATAQLSGTATADAVWEALPFEGRGNRWGNEIYFSIPVDLEPSENARVVVEPGELGYWPKGSAFCIFWGSTPASHGDEPRAASPVNVFGRLEGAPGAFAEVQSGTRVRVERTE